MTKQDEYRFNLKFDEADEDHRRVSEFLNKCGRKKARYIVKAVLAYWELQSGKTPIVERSAETHISLKETVIQKQLLDEALVITYAEKGITHDNQSLEDSDNPGQYKDMPILGDLHEVLLRKRECRRMANILNRLVHGSAATFNQKTNVDLSNKYVVLDISELSGDLLLGMFVALDFVWAKAKEDRTVEKAIFVDEAWKLLVSNELAGEYLLEIFKVIRAYGGSAICATQDLVDFFALKGGKLGRGILNNSKTKIILNMEPSEAENIRKELDLSEAEAMSIARFERGTGLISTNSNNLIVDFKASQLEKDLITTDRKDLQELKERLQKYGRQAYGKQAI